MLLAGTELAAEAVGEVTARHRFTPAKTVSLGEVSPPPEPPAYSSSNGNKMLQVLFISETGVIVQFQDTEQFEYVAPLEGQEVVEITAAQFEKQESYLSVINGKLSKKPPVEPPLPQPSAEVLRERAQAQQYEALRVAAEAMAPLQDAVDLDEATAAEQARLKAWKRYRVALMRVPEQTGYPQAIEWPLAPT